MKTYQITESLLEEQIQINKDLEKCYAYIVETVRRVSNTLDDETLKEVIEIDHREFPGSTATIFECITPYGIVSLGADDTGYFNIVYSLDYRAIDMIGEFALSNLLRNIYRFTMVGFTETTIEHRVKIHGLATEIDFEAIKNFWSRDANQAFVKSIQ